jgi:DNA-binding IclR family transcriptional regulator
VRADEVARTLGKSVSTAYNLLASLCEEGVARHDLGGVYRLAPGFRDAVNAGAARRPPELHDLSGLVDHLLAATHKRSYVAVVRHGELEIVLERGLQGMAKIPGLRTRPGDALHALALGKVVLALGGEVALERYAADHALRAFTPSTITELGALRAELAAVRRDGYAVEREELFADFCCIAAPVRDRRGRVVAVLGISMTRRAFDEERERLAATLAGVAGASLPAPATVARAGAPAPARAARFQPSAETPNVLDPAGPTRLASPYGTTRAVSAACARIPSSASAPARSERRYRP